MIYPTLIIDADDTLWDCQGHYERVMQHLYALLAPWTDRDTAANELFATERKNIHTLGFGCKAFVLSAIETALRVSGNRIPTPDIATLMSEGLALCHIPTTPLPGVKTTLELLHERGHRLVLFTKGELQDQQNKLEGSGLAPLFDHVEITTTKTATEFTALCAKLGVRPADTVMIGNSLSHDIAPALAAGLHAIHVPFAITWQLDHADPITHEWLVTVKEFAEVSKIV